MKIYYRPFTCPSDLIPPGRGVCSPPIYPEGYSERDGCLSARLTQPVEASFTIKEKEEL
ncbi:hypothetical protein OAN13_06020 [Opitutales bacterium]|nr:hypothetical protein [Opitutales bacterium]